jgi:hypothetical protein
MKKTLLALLLLVTAQTQAQTRKCDWSGYWMKKVYQNQNYFRFQTNLGDDTCIDYTWTVYDFQLKRTDTLSDTRGITDVQFNAKGKYKVAIKAINRCTKCDTFMYQYVDITVYGKKAKLSYAPSIKDCKSYTFEMAKIDTCVDHYYEIWNANEYSKNMTDKQWKETSDSLLYFTFEWQEKNLVYYSTASERVLKHEFKDSGRYIVYTYWQNKCTGIDTFAFNKIVVCPKEQLTNVKSIVKSSDIKIIGYYDMMGRQVDYMRDNEVYIVLYSNGQRRKVMRHGK